MTRCTIPCPGHAKPPSKKSPNPSALYILTSKCAWRNNGMHFFDILTSKSAPNLVCFVHFDFEMCFAPQERTFFDISTSKRAPTLRCFAHFDFQMCFAPQRRALFRHHNFQKWSDVGVLCTFWLGHVLRAATACNFSSLIWPHGSAPAALASLPFDPPERATNHCKNTVNRDFSIFSRTCIFFLLRLSLFFSSLALPISAFSICPYCRKFDF